MVHSELAQGLAFLASPVLAQVSALEMAIGLLALRHIPKADHLCSIISQNLEASNLLFLKQGDLTSACAILDALGSYNKTLVTGQHLALLAKRLIAAEVEPGGPYQLPNGVIDFVTNAFIARCIARHAQPLPKVIACLQNSRPDSAYFGPELTRFVMRLAGITLPGSSHQATSIAGAKQQLDGSWPAIIVRHQPRQTSHWLATALALYELCPAPSAPSIKEQPQHAVLQLVHQRLTKLPSPILELCQKALVDMQQADRNQEISLLATYFEKALLRPVDKPGLSTTFGAANMFCWMAYNIFDDFLDNEGSVEQLPVATFCNRQALQLYAEGGSKLAGFGQLVEQTFACMDTANAWEVTYCRAEVTNQYIRLSSLPRYARGSPLAQRSFAHVLGPLALSVASGTPLTSSASQLLQKAFRHYLIARQLNDDLHDWKTDLQAGQLSFVVTYLLRQLRVRPGIHHLDQLTHQMQLYFWQSGLQQLCPLVLRHITLAKKHLKRCSLVAPHNEFELLFDDIAESAKHALQEHNNSKLFLQTFRQP